MNKIIKYSVYIHPNFKTGRICKCGKNYDIRDSKSLKNGLMGSPCCGNIYGNKVVENA